MRYRVTVVFDVDEEGEDLADMEVQAQLEDMLSHNPTTIIGFSVKETEEVETETEDDF